MAAAGDASTRRALGAWCEEVAVRHLESEGWRILDRNVHFRVGELDIIARDGDQVVFVEVRARRRRDHFRAEDSVGHGKQRRLTRAGLLYLQRLGPSVSARFDVMAVDARSGCVVAHHRGAFDAVAMDSG
ncbi:MAG: YraN family protein [Deltaproteobacteria bacterium]|nr:MAG: YraN family protein [Deltaproteobacteria bacterium]